MYFFSSLFFVGVFVVISTSANALAGNDDGARIIGGQQVAGGPFENYPYTASVQLRNQQNQATRGHHCGGALVTNRHVLTSATCVIFVNSTSWAANAPSTYRVFVGSVFLDQDTTARVRNVVGITVHPDFAPSTFFNDLAILQTNTAFNFVDNEIQVITRRTQPMIEGTPCILTGWGGDELMTISERMQVLGANVHNHFECGEAYNTTARLVGYESVCASSLPGTAPCTFDLGGPLVCEGVLSGLLSYAAHCNQFPGAPAVYLRIEAYTTWINTVTSSSLVSSQTSFLLLSVVVFVQLFQFMK